MIDRSKAATQPQIQPQHLQLAGLPAVIARLDLSTICLSNKYVINNIAMTCSGISCHKLRSSFIDAHLLRDSLAPDGQIHRLFLASRFSRAKTKGSWLLVCMFDLEIDVPFQELSQQVVGPCQTVSLV